MASHRTVAGDRALGKVAKSDNIKQLSERVWLVTSGRSGNSYTVYRECNTLTCNCPWGQHGGAGCHHTRAVWAMLAEAKGYRISFWNTETDARRQRRRFYTLAHGHDGKVLFCTLRKVA